MFQFPVSEEKEATPTIEISKEASDTISSKGSTNIPRLFSQSCSHLTERERVVHLGTHSDLTTLASLSIKVWGFGLI